MSNKLDPRIIRTRQLLRTALLQLIPEKGYDSITIQDITDRVLLNRSTFYMHYQNKDDLMETLIQQVLADLADVPRLKSMEEGDVRYVERLYTHIFQHVKRNDDFYKVMLGERSVAGFAQQLQVQIEAIALRWMSVRSWERSNTPPELFTSFISAGFMGIIRWWLFNHLPYSPDFMANQFMRLTLIGMHRDFGIDPDKI